MRFGMEYLREPSYRGPEINVRFGRLFANKESQLTGSQFSLFLGVTSISAPRGNQRDMTHSCGYGNSPCWVMCAL